jgi:hypothetical protein
MNPSEIENLDWGAITPDSYHNEAMEALHIFNFNLTIDENLRRMEIFIGGRLKQYTRNLPTRSSQKVVLDATGQGLTPEQKDAIIERCKQLSVRIGLADSVSFILQG